MCSQTDNPERYAAWRRVVRLALLLAALAAAPAQAVPLVVERLDGDPGSAAAADILAGRHDAHFVGEDYAAITPSRQRGGWYRVRLASDWSQPVPPVISVFDPQGLRARAYLPPDYAEQARSIYDEGNDIGFTRHALVFMLPVTLRADQPFNVYLSAPANNNRLQGMRRGVLPDGEAIEFFAVPVGASQDAVSFEVVFN
jgi:hypothetical protein